MVVMLGKRKETGEKLNIEPCYEITCFRGF